MNKIILTSDQLTRLKNNEQVGLCVPLVEQPPDDPYADGYVCTICKSVGSGVHFNTSVGCSDIPLQYPINKVLGVREEWAYIWLNATKKRYFYESTDREILVENANWHSPQTMPADAIRTHVRVVDNSVKRVQDADWKTILEVVRLMGQERYEVSRTSFGCCIANFKDWFNSQFSKPLPRREKGKIVRYDCWVYDWDFVSEIKGVSCFQSWESIKKRKEIEGNIRTTEIHYEDYEYSYKDLPLEIHPDPFCEFPILEQESK